jgi:hypothetical protein
LDQLALDFDDVRTVGVVGVAGTDSREQSRSEVVRLVEYSPFPRTSRDARKRIGYTRDEHASGLCLAVDRVENVGALLRVVVRSVDGRATLDSVARVVWCLPRDDGRFWLGLALVAKGRRTMQRVQRTSRTRRIDVMA